MAQPPTQLPKGDLDRIYERRIRDDFLVGISASRTPTAILVGGQPGAGKSVALARARSQLRESTGDSVVISGDELREYHPYWRQNAATDPLAATHTQADVRYWYARLIADAVAQRANLVLETSMRVPSGVTGLANELKTAGYDVTVIALAIDMEQSRQTTIARYALAKASGVHPRFVPAANHDEAYAKVRESVTAIESEKAVDRLQLVDRHGRQIYSNQLTNGHWTREPNAAYALDLVRERQVDARELADVALRWQSLSDGLHEDPSVPAEVTRQAAQWRDEAIAKAEADPQAKRFLALHREAKAFSTVNRIEFLEQFTHHAGSVERLEEAIKFAEKQFEDPAERRRFIERTRRSIAERIAEGLAEGADMRKTKMRERSTRTR